MNDNKLASPNVRGLDDFNKIGEPISIEIPESIDDLKHKIIQTENEISKRVIRQAVYFLALKRSIPKGEFNIFLEKNNFPDQRAYEYITVGEMILNAPDELRKKLFGARKTQLITLAKLPLDTIEEFSETGEIDELMQLSVRELKQEVKRYKSRLFETETKLQQREVELIGVRKLSNKSESGKPEFYLNANQQANVFSTRAMQVSDSFYNLANDINSLAGKDEETNEYCQMALNNIAIQAQAALAKMEAQLKKIKMLIGGDPEVKYKHYFDDAEIVAAIKMRQELIQEHKHDEMHQKAQRERSKERGRGRPRKIISE